MNLPRPPRMEALMASRQAEKHSSPPYDAGKWLELSERISRCARLLRGQIAQQSEVSQLADAEFSVLWTCAAAPAGGLSQKELAAALAVSPAHISGLVEQLRSRGFLRGRRAATDRRRRLWQITPEGRMEVRNLLLRLDRWARRMDDQTQGLAGQLTPLIQQLASGIQLVDDCRCCPSEVTTNGRGRKRGAA